jgi:hypothetical protein
LRIISEGLSVVEALLKKIVIDTLGVLGENLTILFRSVQRGIVSMTIQKGIRSNTIPRGIASLTPRKNIISKTPKREVKS